MEPTTQTERTFEVPESLLNRIAEKLLERTGKETFDVLFDLRLLVFRQSQVAKVPESAE